MIRGAVAWAIAGAVVLVAVACGGSTDANDADGRTPSNPAPTTTDATKVIDAPILEAELLVRESFPVQYAVRVVSELPNGCHQFDGVAQSRSGETITIDVTNTVPEDDDAVCTQIYGTHEEVVELGTDFVSGTEYTVLVNDKTITFTAQ